MQPDISTPLIAFSEQRCIASGKAEQVVTLIKSYVDSNPDKNTLILNALTSRVVELDLRAGIEEILTNQFTHSSSLSESDVTKESTMKGTAMASRGRGRPRLGVVSREVTLLPRHWEWLASQPGGASVALRKLVDAARRSNGARDRMRQVQESTYRFMTTLAGNEPGYEEAVRALYADDMEKLFEILSDWPADIASHVRTLVEGQREGV